MIRRVETSWKLASEGRREGDVPFLGTCGGLRYAVVEYFRNVLGAVGASHAESDGRDVSNVIHGMVVEAIAEDAGPR